MGIITNSRLTGSVVHDSVGELCPFQLLMVCTHFDRQFSSILLDLCACRLEWNVDFRSYAYHGVVLRWSYEC